MNDINPNQLLSQLQVLARQASGVQAVGTVPAGDENEKTEFSSLIKNSIDAVNAKQQEASSLVRAFELNDPSVSLSQVMIERQKAKIAFEALSQVRNQVVSAYRDIMNMPL